MNIINKLTPTIHRCAALLMVLLVASTPARAATLVETGQQPYGTFKGVEYVRYTGRFIGTTARGAFRVPYEIVAPMDPRNSNKVVVIEPPHFELLLPGREGTLGAEFLFNRRYMHASVGFSNQGFNMLEYDAPDVMIAGMEVKQGQFPLPRDVEIIKQFALAMRTDATARSSVGYVRKLYAFGISQTAEALYELAYTVGAEDVFDLTVLHVPLWRPAFARPDTLALLPETFKPLPNIGKVMLVSAEGDLLISKSKELRRARSNPNYRLYEVSGAPHLFFDAQFGDVQTNKLDLAPVARAAFVAGNRWVRLGEQPPGNRTLMTTEPDAIDPMYGFPTGIRRDANGNARGGIRFPDINNGRTLHIASLLDIEVIPGIPGLIGAQVDLACAPKPGSTSGLPRLRNKYAYLQTIHKQAFKLVWLGYLLPSDAWDMIRAARESGVGEPGSCQAAP